MEQIERAGLDALARHSIEVILENQAPSGAYLASPAFPVYRYSWFRDGAFIADAMSRSGHRESAERFFAWCARVLVDRSQTIESLIERRRVGRQIQPSDFLHARYTVDGDNSPEDWWTFQLDGYGAWLWALGEHVTRHNGSVEPYLEAVGLSVRYLATFWSEPCYDWWEEHVAERHTSTLGAIHAGLVMAAGCEGLPGELRRAAEETTIEICRAVAADGVHGGRLTKWLGGADADASLIACATPFKLIDPCGPVAAATIAYLEDGLAHLGVHRYASDTYFGGGEWLLLAGLLGWHYAEVGRTEDAWRQLAWIAEQQGPEGQLPEQVSGHLLHPESRAEWVARWGPIASPLLWSHAMYLTLWTALSIVASSVTADRVNEPT